MTETQDPRFATPDLNAEQLGELMGLTKRQVKDRVAKKVFICHWSGGTPENPRGMRFTPEDVEFNRNTGASRTVARQALAEARIHKGVARLRRSQQVA